MRRSILLADVTALRAATYHFKAGDMGKAMLVAMHIADTGPIRIDEIRKIARLRGRQEWLDDFSERPLFVRDGDFLHLRPDMFEVRHVGSDGVRGKISTAVRELIHERDSYRCAYCETGEGPFEIDHIHPVSRGGTDDPDNLCLACKPCNRAKSNKLVSEWTA